MLFFVCDKNPLFQFSLKFEQHDLDHTHIEVSFDGFAYRFPKFYMKEWLGIHGVEWEWDCRKTEVWQGEPHTLTVDPHSQPPVIRFSTEDDAVFFKLTWDVR